VPNARLKRKIFVPNTLLHPKADFWCQTFDIQKHFSSNPFKVIPIPKSCLTIRYAINYVATILIKWSPLLTRIPNLIFFLHACIFPRKSKSRFSLSVKYKPHDSGCCFYFNSLFCWIDKIELLLNKKVITCVDLKHVMHIHCKKMG